MKAVPSADRCAAKKMYADCTVTVIASRCPYWRVIGDLCQEHHDLEQRSGRTLPRVTAPVLPKEMSR